MKVKQYQPLLTLTAAALIALGLHKLLFMFVLAPGIDADFIRPLGMLYGFFFLMSAFILFVLIKVREASPSHVGLTFILLTTFKMGIAYVFLKPVLQNSHAHSGLEKTNFLVVFLLFLTIETLITIRLINNKQE